MGSNPAIPTNGSCGQAFSVTQRIMRAMHAFRIPQVDASLSAPKLYIPSDLAEYARWHEGIISFGETAASLIRVDEAQWSFNADFPVSSFLWGDNTVQTWRASFMEEMALKAAGGYADYYGDMIGKPVEEPVVAIRYLDRWHIMDGFHRAGSRFYSNYATIPAVLGVTTPDIERRAQAEWAEIERSISERSAI